DDLSIAVPQGSRDSIVVTVTRQNLEQPVQLSVLGSLPPGVTSSFSQNPVPAGVTSTRLRFIATGQAAPGNATVTLRGRSEGVPDKSEDIDVTVTLTGSYTLGVLQPSVTVAQGGGGDAVVLLTRSSGNASAVTLDVTGAPAGLAVTTPPPVNDGGATLAITAAAGVPAGTYPLTITSTAEGFTPPTQSTQLSVVVIAPQPTVSVTVPFCSGFTPVWFAYKNEGALWQRVTPTGSSFTFDASARVAVAFAYQVTGAVELDVYYATRLGLTGLTDRDCDGNKSLSGNVVGLTAGQAGVVTMGASGTSTTAGPFTLQALAARPLDIVATRGTLGGGSLIPDRMVIRRSQDLTGTIPDIDFLAAESFVPVSSNLTVSGFTNGFAIDFRSDLWSATSTHGTFHAASATGGTAQLWSVPGAQLIAGDVHELVVEAYSGATGHAKVAYYSSTGDRTETLGPLLPSPTLTVAATHPYMRARAQIAAQAEYPAATQFILFQTVGGTARFLNIVGTAPHFGATPTTWDLVVPDLSGVTGFSSEWLLQGSQATQWQAYAYAGRDDLLFGALPVAGESYSFAYQFSTTPTLLLRLPSAKPGRRAPLLSQYFRR
ncbi:MAG: hypothetical protein ACRENU_17730, partial [Gemmatimonadaceae bacterium]